MNKKILIGGILLLIVSLGVFYLKPWQFLWLSKQCIVGNWLSNERKEREMLFFKDHTFKILDDGRTFSGTYILEGDCDIIISGKWIGQNVPTELNIKMIDCDNLEFENIVYSKRIAKF